MARQIIFAAVLKIYNHKNLTLLRFAGNRNISHPYIKSIRLSSWTTSFITKTPGSCWHRFMLLNIVQEYPLKNFLKNSPLRLECINPLTGLFWISFKIQFATLSRSSSWVLKEFECFCLSYVSKSISINALHALIILEMLIYSWFLSIQYCTK